MGVFHIKQIVSGCQALSGELARTDLPCGEAGQSKLDPGCLDSPQAGKFKGVTAIEGLETSI